MILQENEILIVSAIKEPNKYYLLREFGTQPPFYIRDKKIFCNEVLTLREKQFITKKLIEQ